MKIVRLVCVFTMLLLAGCCSNPSNNSNIPAAAIEFDVDYSVAEMKPCDLNTAKLSEITLDRANVPKNTHFLKLKVEDISFNNLLHGVTILNYDQTGTSDVIALEFFRLQPFCPIIDSPHEYQLTVYALDKNHIVIGYGQISKMFSM